METSDKKSDKRVLHPLPRGLVEIYGLVAVLVVIIPEWLADGTLNLGRARRKESLPMRSRAWNTIPELRLASMNLNEMRLMARKLKLFQYAADNRDQLTTRLLKCVHNRDRL